MVRSPTITSSKDPCPASLSDALDGSPEAGWLLTETDFIEEKVSVRINFFSRSNLIVPPESSIPRIERSSQANLKMGPNPSKFIVRCGSLPRQESADSFFPVPRARPSGSRASILSREEHSRLQRRTFRRQPSLRRSCAWSALPRHGGGLRRRSRRALLRSVIRFP